VKEEDLQRLYTIKQSEWQNFADLHKGTVVSKWGMKPSSIRVDQIDRDVESSEQGQLMTPHSVFFGFSLIFVFFINSSYFNVLLL